MANTQQKFLPKRIILVRHGESEGNEDEQVLEYVPNYKIKLSNKGTHQAHKTGLIIKDLVSHYGESENSKVFFYVSPSNRTRETMERIINRGSGDLIFPDDQVLGIREECRLREQHFGNFQEMEKRKNIKRTRCSYGKFFYRVPDGESSADVFDRVSSKFTLLCLSAITHVSLLLFHGTHTNEDVSGFVEVLWRDMEMNKFKSGDEDVNLIIVSHGLTILLFLMKWFGWTVDEFEELTNPRNCEYRVLQLGCNNEDYSLAIHHKIEELKEWGLSDQMIQDQMLRSCSGSIEHDHQCHLEHTTMEE